MTKEGSVTKATNWYKRYLHLAPQDQQIELKDYFNAGEVAIAFTTLVELIVDEGVMGQVEEDDVENLAFLLSEMHVASGKATRLVEAADSQRR